jgi:hypothetical protein
LLCSRLAELAGSKGVSLPPLQEIRSSEAQTMPIISMSILDMSMACKLQEAVSKIKRCF